MITKQELIDIGYVFGKHSWDSDTCSIPYSKFDINLEDGVIYFIQICGEYDSGLSTNIQTISDLNIFLSFLK